MGVRDGHRYLAECGLSCKKQEGRVSALLPTATSWQIPGYRFSSQNPSQTKTQMMGANILTSPLV
jgi:hypothetical protein